MSAGVGDGGEREGAEPRAGESAGIRVGDGAHVEQITVHGDVAGRDIVHITAEQSYDVSELSANPYRGLASFTYETRAFYGGRDQQIGEAVRRLTGAGGGERPWLVFVTGASGSGKSSFVQAGVVPALEAALGEGLRWAVTRPGRQPLAAIERALGSSAGHHDDGGTLVCDDDGGQRGAGGGQTDEGDGQRGAGGGQAGDGDGQHRAGGGQADEGGGQRGAGGEQTGEGGGQADDGDGQYGDGEAGGQADEGGGQDREGDAGGQDDEGGGQDGKSEAGGEYGEGAGQRGRTAGDGERLRVLVLDQFEELFTQAELTERRKAIDWLGNKQTGVQVIATLRSDYLPAIFNEAELFGQFKQHGIELRAMTPTELAQAIRQPLLEQARRDGKERRIQAALVERLVEDVGTEATLLPLLQVTLTALWDVPPHTLTLERYRSLTDALEEQAERAYAFDAVGDRRGQADRDEIEGIFLDLVEVSLDDDAQRDVRRTVSKVELTRNTPARGRLIDELVSARLLATTLDQSGRELVDIIHETLLRSWPRLRAAIQQARQRLQMGVRFRLALREWLAHARSDEYLLDGVRLAEGRALASTRELATQSEDARALLAASEAHEAAERQHELEQVRALAEAQRARAEESGRSARRLRVWLIATALAGLAALVAAGIAAAAYVQADRQARINASRELAAVALTQFQADPELAILLAREGARVADTQQANEALRSVLARSPARLALRQSDAAIGSAAFSPDGTRVVTGASDGSVRLWDVPSGQVARELRAGGGGRGIGMVSFSSDGEHIYASSQDSGGWLWNLAGAVVGQPGGGRATANAWSADGARLAVGTIGGEVRMFDARSGRELAVWQAHPSAITSLSFSGDGKRLASGGFEPIARVWTAATGQQELQLNVGARVAAVAIDPRGLIIATASPDQPTTVWSAMDGEPLPQQPWTFGPFPAWVTLGDKDAHLLTAGADGLSRVWDWSTGKVKTVFQGHSGPVLMARFDAAERKVITAGQDHTARIWDVDTGQSLAVLRGHEREVTSAQFSADGKSALTTSLDGSARIWAVDSGREWVELTGHTDKLYTAAFSPDGRELATGGRDTLFNIWNDLKLTSQTTASEVLTSMAYSPDGRWLAWATQSGRAALNGTPQLSLDGHQGAIYTIDFSPDSAHAITASADGTARVWSTQSGQVEWTLEGHTGDVTNATYARSGERIATSSMDGTVRIWDVAAHQTVRTINSGKSHHVVFSADGKQIITAGADGMLRVFEVETGKELKALSGHTGAVYTVDLSADGHLLVSASADKTVLVWDTVTWQRIAELRGSTDEVTSATFSKDQQRVVASSADATARVYSREMFAPIDEMLALVPSRVTRAVKELTAEERQRFVATSQR